jgi:hypothetical protein
MEVALKDVFEALFLEAGEAELVTVFDLETASNVYAQPAKDVLGNFPQFLSHFDGKPQKYLQCGTRKVTSEVRAGNKTRGGKHDVHTIHFLWADVDCQHATRGADSHKYATRDMALMALTKMAYPPTIIVDSGRGLHPYWCLLDPVELGDSMHIGKLEASLTRAWILLVRQAINKLSMANFNLDNVGDVTRMMRCPGSFNEKSKKRCDVIHFKPEYRYWADEMADMCSNFATEPRPASKPFRGCERQIATTVPIRVRVLIGNSHQLAGLWHRKVDFRVRGGAVPSASDYCWEMGRLMARAGLDYETIFDALTYWQANVWKHTDENAIRRKAHITTDRLLQQATNRTRPPNMPPNRRANDQAPIASTLTNTDDEPTEAELRESLLLAAELKALQSLKEPIQQAPPKKDTVHAAPEPLEPDESPENNRGAQLALLENLTHLNWEKVVKSGDKTSGVYTAVINNTFVYLGPLKEWSASPFALCRLLGEAFRGVNVHLTKGEFQQAVGYIRSIEEWAETDAYSPRRKVIDVLRRYLAEFAPQPFDKRDKALSEHKPYFDQDGFLRVHPINFYKFLKDICRLDMSADAVRVEFHLSGWACESPFAVPSKQTKSKSDKEQLSHYKIPPRWDS